MMVSESAHSVWGRRPEDCPHLRRAFHPDDAFCLLESQGGNMSPVRRKKYREQICRTSQHVACRLFLECGSRGSRKRFWETMEEEQKGKKNE
ncbi:MAG: hypothetical protein ACYCYP_04135 [Leptospirales bacterium]